MNKKNKFNNQDFISFERKGKNKIKRVENHKIKVAIEVDMVCGIEKMR